jgi:hypothetical protein
VTSPGRPEWTRTRPGRIVLLVLAGIALWLILWAIERPRARYDTLFYATFTYEDAGRPAIESRALAWDLTVRYATPEFPPTVAHDPTSAWFTGWDDPMRQRWIGIYAMRPVMPWLGAAAFPLLGIEAPVVATVAAVILVVLVTGLLLSPLAGALAAALFVFLTAANPWIAGWLTFLMPDGLGLAFWLMALAATALYVRDGRLVWLGVTGIATLLLAFTRPSVVVIPIALAACAVVAVLGRGPWRRFALATVVTALATGVFTLYAAVLHFPSFGDALQDLPTEHFVKPDVASPLRFLLDHDSGLLRQLPSALVDHPLVSLAVVLTVVLAVVGFGVTRRWWIAPFVAALAAVPMLVAVHPVSTEIVRTVAPAWISVNLGLALLVVAARDRIRGRA